MYILAFEHLSKNQPKAPSITTRSLWAAFVISTKYLQMNVTLMKSNSQNTHSKNKCHGRGHNNLDPQLSLNTKNKEIYIMC